MRRGRTARDIQPPLELQCLRALWALGEGNVQAVKDRLAPVKPLAYTTVMTMLERLTRKQVLGRRKVGRSFVYTPLVGIEEMRERAVRDLAGSLFDGSLELLAAYAGGKPAAVRAPQENEPERLDAALL